MRAAPAAVTNLTGLTQFSVGDNRRASSVARGARARPTRARQRSTSPLTTLSRSITGTVPSWLGSITGLNQLLLAENLFVGTIPASRAHFGGGQGADMGYAPVSFTPPVWWPPRPLPPVVARPAAHHTRGR